ncbi:MAG: rRNA methyltransferase, partial [Candidatus Omnitrophica bacterium]|nr:rRNA methyltransferase [Candidatus Omnitrophota bacterium]
LVKSTSESQNCPLNLCFAEIIFHNPIEITAPSSNDFASKLVNYFLESIQKKIIISSLPFYFGSVNNEKLISRAKTIKKYLKNKLIKKVSRISKLFNNSIPYISKFNEGFFVYLINFDCGFVSINALTQGQQRMKMSPDDPSRSYLKIEEAYNIIGFEPLNKEKVIDLGAAPGGWTYSAVKRGAYVTAVDNGPLKKPIKSNPLVIHIKEDALKFIPPKGQITDWLFCDIIKNPDIILNLIKKWLKNSWCRNFVVNLKISLTDPIALLKKIEDKKTGLSAYCSLLKIRQLYHDREEIT